MKQAFRIYTEDKNREMVKAIVGKYFNGFTLTEATGYWKGSEEKSLVIEVIEDSYKAANIYRAAQDIKEYNKQEAVLVVRLPLIDANLV